MVLRVKDLMTAKPVFLKPEDSILKAAQVLYSHNYHGLPVVDDDNKVIGILTEHDFISKGAYIHLPTLMELMRRFPFNENDKILISGELKKMLALRVRDIMNDDPLVISGDAGVFEVAKIFTEHHKVNPIPVIDSEHRLIGVISRNDIIKLYVSPSANSFDVGNEKKIGLGVESFLSNFQKQFVVVSRFRSRFWFILSFMFIIIGFLIALALVFKVGS
jgi:CBS domain-containing protein